MRILIFIILVLPGSSVFGQRKYEGKTTQIEQGPELKSLFIAGISFQETGMKFTGSDTLKNGKIIFRKCQLGVIPAVKIEIIVEAGVLVQFQVNVYTYDYTRQLVSDCQSVYGKPKKSSKTKSNEMVVWESQSASGKKIQTVLITGNKNRKAELVTWQL